jgi:hypothetical protein
VLGAARRKEAGKDYRAGYYTQPTLGEAKVV